MSKYVLVYLPSKEVSDFNEKLVSEVGPKFGEDYLVENPRPPHVTIKSPFLMEDIKPVEEFLNKFVKTCKSSEVFVEGFDNFRRFVAFLNAKFSKEGFDLQRKLVSELSQFKEIEVHEFDLKWHPHLTVSYGNTPENFDKIWAYLSKMPQPNFEMKFDNISILIKEGNSWKVYRRFDIK